MSKTNSPVLNTGGFAAPPLDNKRISKYKLLAKDADLEIREAMEALLRLESTRPKSKLAAGSPIPKEELETIDAHIPWDRELKSYSELFSSIPADTSKELRDAAYHLLWWTEYIAKGIEPPTLDKF